MSAYTFSVNGDPVEVDAPGMRRLLDVLREDLGLTGTKHESTGAPSTSTVHAPHSPSPQPSFVPVNPRSSRRTSRSRRMPGASTSTGSPFTMNE